MEMQAINRQLEIFRTLGPDALDGRSQIGKAVKGLKTALEDYVVASGGKVTPPVAILIGTITYKAMRLANYQKVQITKPGHEEVAIYLTMSNSLRLDLQALANMAGEIKPPDPDLADYIAKHYGKGKSGRD